MTLASLIRDEIARDVFMRIDRYMSLCLMHPQFGYYTRRDPFGKTGDFVTAPEVSQMFGEMIGLWLAQVWQDQGAPSATLLELGPGRGTLMADVLRVCGKIPGFRERVSVRLIEQSPHLAALQKSALAWPRIDWRPTIADLPDEPIYLIANEFFDALPIRQAERIDDIWLERVIRFTDSQLRPGHAPLDVSVARRLPKIARDGEVAEWSEASQRIAATLGGHIAAHGGAGLIVDYGNNGGSGDTLQAVKDHEYCSTLNDPGSADLSAHVDFAAIADAAVPAKAPPLLEQGRFLAALGIGARAGQLAREADANKIADALDRLTSDQEMGSLFKVLGLRHPDSPPLPVLEPSC